MFKWAVLLLAAITMVACLGAMGVGAKAMAELLVALGIMGGISLAIAWIFLRKSSSTEIETGDAAEEPAGPLNGTQ